MVKVTKSRCGPAFFFTHFTYQPVPMYPVSGDLTAILSEVCPMNEPSQSDIHLRVTYARAASWLRKEIEAVGRAPGHVRTNGRILATGGTAADAWWLLCTHTSSSP